MDEEANLDDESFRSDLERDSAHSSMNIEQRQDFQHFEGRVSGFFFQSLTKLIFPFFWTILFSRPQQQISERVMS